jgi:predicted metal-dependent phosphoesterase TrpH
MITNQLSKADLHIHSTHSDGTASIPEILAHMASSDVCVIAITDHDCIAGGRQAAQLARDFGVQVIVGEEVSTAEGHLLALFIDDELPPGRPAAETIAAIHAQGGLCIAAHPYDRSVPSLGAYGLHARSAGAGQGEWPLDAIEGLNAGVMWAKRSSNLRAQMVACDLQLPIVGGSDAHSLATIGQAYTLFPGTSADDLYRAIQRGDVSCGGGYWSAGQYVDVSRRWVRQRGLHGLVRLALDGAGITQRKRVEVPEKGLPSSLPI